MQVEVLLLKFKTLNSECHLSNCPECKDYYRAPQIKIAQIQILFCHFQTGVKKNVARMCVTYQCELMVSEKIIIFASSLVPVLPVFFLSAYVLCSSTV